MVYFIYTRTKISCDKSCDFGFVVVVFCTYLRFQSVWGNFHVLCHHHLREIGNSDKDEFRAVSEFDSRAPEAVERSS